jgi:hypothetical protein
MMSYRLAGFVRAKCHFVCNYGHELVRIDRHERTLALMQDERVMDVEGDELEPASENADGKDWSR